MRKCANYFWVIALILLTSILYSCVQAEAEEVVTLTPSYFLSTPGKALIYQYQSNGIIDRQMAVWEKDETGIYTNSIVYDDGAYNFAKYVLGDNNEVAQIDSGFSVPRSEWSNDPIILGKNIVFKGVDAGSAWTNDYQTKDAWETVCRYRNKYTLVGFENIVLMGKEVNAARINWSEEKTIVSESPNGAEWVQIPYNSTHDQWYVNGVGLVKSSSIMENPFTNERYVRTGILVDVIDVMGSVST